MSTTPADLLEQYFTYLGSRLREYEAGKERAYKYWYSAQTISLWAGASAALVTAMVGKDSFSWAKYVIIFLTSLGSISVAYMKNFRLYDLWRLREDGVITLKATIQAARPEVGACSSPETFTALHKKLVSDVNKIEENQVTKWFALPLGVPLPPTTETARPQSQKRK